GAVGWHDRLAIAVVRLRAALVVDLVPDALPARGPLSVAVVVAVLQRADGAVEGDPCHDLGVREVLAGPPYLPDAFVGSFPSVFEEVEQGEDEVVGVDLALCDRADATLIHRADQLSRDVRLELVRRLVADPDRMRALVAGQPLDLPLGEAAFPGRAVHDLEGIGLAGDGPQEPGAPRSGLLLVSGVEEREERERRV